jgi:hypothetical protein
MGVLSQEEIALESADRLSGNDGTEVVWRKCDRLSEGGELTEDQFNSLIVLAMDELALIFHRYLEGDSVRKISISVNNNKIEPFDPFYRKHNATIVREAESLFVGDKQVMIRPYILPHFSKLKENEYKKLGGKDGFLRNQGIYLYREGRLIIYGTWFRLLKFGELSQLVRISVDIPNSIDDEWKITLDKSDAQLPTALRARLKQIVDKLKRESTRVYRSRGGNIDSPRKVAVWSRLTKNNDISYEINRDHPVVSALLESANSELADSVLNLIEKNFPVSAFVEDANLRSNSIGQSPMNRAEMKALLDIAVSEILLSLDGSIPRTIESLKKTEPFSANWPMVAEYLAEKGWK